MSIGKGICIQPIEAWASIHAGYRIAGHADSTALWICRSIISDTSEAEKAWARNQSSTKEASICSWNSVLICYYVYCQVVII